MKKIIPILIAAAFSVVSCSKKEAVDIPAEERDVIVAFITPYFPDDETEESIFGDLTHLALHELGLADTLRIYDGLTLEPVASFEMPSHPVYADNVKLRKTHFKEAFNDCRDWFLAERENAQEDMLSINAPEIYRFASTLNLPEHASILIIGSPIFTRSNEFAWSMADQYVPSDGAIAAKKADCVYGVGGQKGRLQGVSVHWVYMQDDVFAHSAHRARCERFWSALTQFQSATLRSGEIHLSAVLPRLLNGYSAQLPCADFDPQAKIEMIKIVAPGRVYVDDPIDGGGEVNQGQSEEVLPEVVSSVPSSPYGFLTTSAVASSPIEVESLSNVRIGCTWNTPNTDIDIYVKNGRKTELYYSHKRNRDGSRHIKDILRPENGAFEVVDLGANQVVLGDLKISVNNFDSPRSTEPIVITVRLQSGTGEVYSKTVTLPANGGNGGRGPSLANAVPRPV